MVKVLCSFYDESSSPNRTVSLLGSVVCPECSNRAWVFKDKEPKCLRCNGDKLLTNQLQFNSNLMEAAAAPSFAKEQGLKLGDVIKVTYSKFIKGYCGKEDIAIYLRLTDYMADNMYTEKGRGIDLTKHAFEQLSPLEKGIIQAEVSKV